MRSLWGTCKLEDEAAQASSLSYTDFKAQTGSKRKAIIDRKTERQKGNQNHMEAKGEENFKK